MRTMRRYGPWAIVTGASSGLGAEFARQLAQAGLNVVITARRLAILEELKRELEDRHGVQIRCVATDLSAVEGPDMLTKATLDLDVGLLVSNAGHVVPGSFLGNDPADYDAVIRLNVRAPTLLAHHYGRKMAIRGSGGIIFTSSITGFGPLPYMANYGGTKSYLSSFGPALRFELAKYGIDVSLLAPGPTDTPMATETSALQGKMYLMKVGPVVRESLRRLPSSAIVVPGIMYKCAIFFMTRFLSRWGYTRLWGYALKNMMVPRVLDPQLGPPSSDDG